MVLKFILSMYASKDVLAMASLEVYLYSIEPKRTITVKWHKNNVFIRIFPEDEIQLENNINVNSLCNPQEDAGKFLNMEWLVVIGVCTHLGFVSFPNDGDYGGWLCPFSGLVPFQITYRIVAKFQGLRNGGMLTHHHSFSLSNSSILEQ